MSQKTRIIQDTIVFKGRESPSKKTEKAYLVKVRVVSPSSRRAERARQRSPRTQGARNPKDTANNKYRQNIHNEASNKVPVSLRDNGTGNTKSGAPDSSKDAKDSKSDMSKASSTTKNGGKLAVAKKELKCGLCTDKFHEPKLLSCLHSFCQNCLRRYVEKGKYKKSFPCPLCSRSIDIPKNGGVRSLPANMYLVASESTDKAPPCDICDTGARAADRCLDCEENMCTNCLSYHNKMKATRVHRTAPIGDNTKSKAKIQQKQYCDQHEQEELRFYCVPCAKIVCRDCKTINHTVHQTLELNDVAEGRKRDIGKSLRHTKEFLPKIQGHIKTLTAMAKSLEKNTQETTKEIKGQAKKLHEEIDRMAAEMISEIKQKNKEMENTLQRNIRSAEVVYASMESIILAAESFMNVGSDHDVIENSVNIKNRVENLPKEVPGESVDFVEFKFRPGPIPSTDLWICFGNWTSDVAASVAISIPRQIGPAMALMVRELSSFAVLGGKAIISIAPSKDGNAWLCNSLSEHIFLYTKSGQCRTHVKAGFEVGDIYVASDDTLMMSFPSQRKIRRMTGNGQITDFANLPMYPAGLTQMESGDILVCAMEKLGESVRGPDSKGAVLRVNNFGRVEKFDKERRTNLFTRPIRVTVNANKDIIVSEWAKGNDHVVALTADGKMKWQYHGPTTVELAHTFVPNALATDKYCQILIADSHNRAVHLVDKDGHFIKLLLTEKDGLGEPWSVAVDSEGFLWVGDTEGNVRVYKYMS
ncbi:TRI56-like protein [Mya arenaria]|uniref:TRI56-like protein n=3 Tax=Mya arenaria TaxID=6604 RepID=A0ABY7DLZ7_MYAAR|nr:TRI56-like protein [Mya arenaria]